MMNRYAIGIFITALGITACSSCSNGSSGDDGGGGGGSCKHVDICTVIPLATVNSGTNKMCGTAALMSNDTALVSDECDYTGVNSCGYVNMIRECWASSDTMLGSAAYDGDKAAYLAPMGTRTDVAGLGEKAFYQSEPSGAGVPTTKVRLETWKSPILVVLTASAIAPADDAKVKQSLIGYTNTLLQ